MFPVCPCTAPVYEQYREGQGDYQQSAGDLSKEHQTLSPTIRYVLVWYKSDQMFFGF